MYAIDERKRKAICASCLIGFLRLVLAVDLVTLIRRMRKTGKIYEIMDI